MATYIEKYTKIKRKTGRLLPVHFIVKSSNAFRETLRTNTMTRVTLARIFSPIVAIHTTQTTILSRRQLSKGNDRMDRTCGHLSQLVGLTVITTLIHYYFISIVQKRLGQAPSKLEMVHTVFHLHIFVSRKSICFCHSQKERQAAHFPAAICLHDIVKRRHVVPALVGSINSSTLVGLILFKNKRTMERMHTTIDPSVNRGTRSS